MTYGKRLDQALTHAGKSRKDLANHLGCAPQTIGIVITGAGKIERKLSTGNHSKAVDFLRINGDWLLNGTGEMLPEDSPSNKPLALVNQAHDAITSISNISAARAYSGEVPVINWVQAGQWQDVCEAIEPERYLPIFRGHSSNSYALRVRGDSMTAAHGKSYPDGCFVIVDPAKVAPVNGDRVIARLKGQREATFKVFKNEDGKQWLAPLNTMHKPIYDGFTVVGTVIGKWEDE